MASLRLHSSAPADIEHPLGWPTVESKGKGGTHDTEVASAPKELATLEQMRSTEYLLCQKGWKVGAHIEWTDKSVYKIIKQHDGSFEAELVCANVNDRCVVRVKWDYLMSRENKWKMKDSEKKSGNR